MRSRIFAVAFTGLFLAVGVALLAAAIVPAALDHRRVHRVEADGIDTVGIVLAKSRERAGDVTFLGGRRALVDYLVRYRFESRGGGRSEGVARVSRSAWAWLEERGPIDVRYLQDDAHASIVAGELPRNVVNASIFGVVGGLFAAVGALGLFAVLRSP